MIAGSDTGNSTAAMFAIEYAAKMPAMPNYAYDLNGRMETITSGGFSSSVDFDDVGNLSSMTDGNQISTSHQYDALNRLTSSTDALSRVVSTTYDDHDNALSVSLAGGVTTSYEYDDLDNRTKEISSDRGTILYVYDEAGNVVSMTDARGKVTDYDYDALNRLVLETLDGSQTIAYSYDTGANGIGRLVTITDSSGSTTRSYNAFGEVTQKVQSIAGVALTTAYGYDAQGRLTSLTLPSGKIVSYGYNSFLPVSVTVDSTTVLTNATYEPFGSASGWQWGNSDTLSRSYDARGLLESTTVGDDTWTYVRDGVGNVLTINDGTFDEYFEYDDIGRLFEYAQAIGLQWPPLRSEGYLYDVNGNRTRTFHDLVPYDPLPPPTNSNRVPSPLTPISSKTNTYDAAGNTLSDGIHTYGYDDRGRLVDVDAGSVTYLHNGEGQRVKKDDGTEILFAYDESGATIGEYDSTGSPITEHVWFNGVPVVVISGSAIHYVYTDHLGTPRAISDTGGTVIWRWVTYPFGDTASDEDPDGNQVSFEYNLRFPGQYYDEETGLHYNYYRTYDPSTGRYLESDPIGLNAGLNTYTYVGNMPTMRADVFGLTPTDVRQLRNLIENQTADIRIKSWEFGEIDSDTLAQTDPWSGKVTLPEKYRECLSRDEFVDLADSLLHEGMHSSDPLGTRLWDAFRGSKTTRNHQSIYARTRWELGQSALQPDLAAGETIDDYMGRSSELYFSGDLWGLGNVRQKGSNRNPASLAGKINDLYDKLYSGGEYNCECSN